MNGITPIKRQCSHSNMPFYNNMWFIGDHRENDDCFARVYVATPSASNFGLKRNKRFDTISQFVNECDGRHGCFGFDFLCQLLFLRLSCSFFGCVKDWNGASNKLIYYFISSPIARYCKIIFIILFIYLCSNACINRRKLNLKVHNIKCRHIIHKKL